MQRFAESLEVVPRTLAETCGMDATQFVADLYAAHEAKPSDAKTDDAAPGVGQALARGCDVDECCVGDMAQKRVWDLLAAKRSALVLAADAASTILKVDQIIMARRAGGPKIRAPGARDAS
jgi:T-complex protein 1 subunit theta